MSLSEEVRSSRAKIPVPFRIGQAGLDWIDSLARANYPLRRAHVIRACLAVAKNHEKEVRDMLKEMQ